jgi:hypothetical protein
MTKITSSMLKYQWKHIYDNTKYHRKTSKFANNERHKVFNNSLLEYLYKAQENQYLPSKNKMESLGIKLLAETEQKLSMGNADKDRFSAEKIDGSLTEMTFAAILTDHDEEGPLETTYLIVYGIVSIKGLTKSEQEIFELCYLNNSEYDESFDAIKIRLMQIPVSIENITEEKQDEINEYCLRVSREFMRNYLKKEKKMDTVFKYGLVQKLKDKWLDGSI